MENLSYFPVYRKRINFDESAHKFRAWVDFCSMAFWEERMADDGVLERENEVIATYGNLARRWNESKTNVYRWIQSWIEEGRLERRSERCVERNAERFLVVDLAKIRKLTEQQMERRLERRMERHIGDNNINNKIIVDDARKVSNDEKPTAQQLASVHPTSLKVFEKAQAAAKEFKLRSEVDLSRLDALICRYLAKTQVNIKFSEEVWKCALWRAENGKYNLSVSHLTNWFAREARAQKNSTIKNMLYRKAREEGTSTHARGLSKPRQGEETEVY